MYKEINGDTWYKVQFHTHTTVSDGRCTPEEVAEIYKAAGFDVIAFTDHWRFGEQQELSGLTILSGCEYNYGTADTAAGVMHIVGVGMDKEPKLDRAVASYQETVDAIKSAGGFAILAHPFWSLNTIEETLGIRGFDAVEIYNSVSDLEINSRPYSGAFVDMLANQAVYLPIIATDDAHRYNGKDDTVSYIMVKAKSKSKNDILDAVRRCDFYATQGPRLSVKKDGAKITAESSECVKITFFSNLAQARDRVVSGDAVTYGEYSVKPGEKWVRVEVLDKDGKYAWSNIIEI